MKMKIGNKRIIFNETIFVPDNEIAEIEYQITETDLLRCRFIFSQGVDDQEGKKNPFTTIEFHDGLFDFKFNNFTNFLGYTTAEPSLFGYTDNKERLVYVAEVSKITNFTKLEIQIMVEVLP